jgi:hypothetical protein
VIYTSSWFTALPEGMLRLGISRGTPRGFPAGYRRLPELQPGTWFNSVSESEYRRRYFDEVLGRLNPEALVKKIETLAAGQTPVLVCYEAPADDKAWCHRGYVSAWLQERLGLSIPEFGMEGVGWQHPKIPRAFRTKSELQDPQAGFAF